MTNNVFDILNGAEKVRLFYVVLNLLVDSLSYKISKDLIFLPSRIRTQGISPQLESVFENLLQNNQTYKKFSKYIQLQDIRHISPVYFDTLVDLTSSLQQIISYPINFKELKIKELFPEVTSITIMNGVFEREDSSVYLNSENILAQEYDFFTQHRDEISFNITRSTTFETVAKYVIYMKGSHFSFLEILDYEIVTDDDEIIIMCE